jgi:hypothetical protein
MLGGEFYELPAFGISPFAVVHLKAIEAAAK